MPCRICQYNQVNDINRAFLAGATPTSVNQRYKSFSIPELQRHQEHLDQKMAQAQTRFHHLLQQSLFLKLHLVMEMVFSVVQGARGGGDFKLFPRPAGNSPASSASCTKWLCPWTRR